MGKKSIENGYISDDELEVYISQFDNIVPRGNR